MIGLLFYLSRCREILIKVSHRGSWMRKCELRLFWWLGENPGQWGKSSISHPLSGKTQKTLPSSFHCVIQQRMENLLCQTEDREEGSWGVWGESWKIWHAEGILCGHPWETDFSKGRLPGLYVLELSRLGITRPNEDCVMEESGVWVGRTGNEKGGEGTKTLQYLSFS